jgi:predicted HAD superfamily hydrolase
MSANFRAHVAAHDLISFDVFDTLILRAIDRPVDVFALVKLKLLTSRAALMNPEIVNAFPEVRIEAERQARRLKATAAGHAEVSFDEIYETFAELTGADSALIALLKATELATEHELVYANPVAAEMFAYARAQGKPIVLCSDMYLPEATVRELLARCGYDGYRALYVSCDHAKSKHVGTMFAFVAAQHGVATDRVLHVGDNAHGDLVMAQAAGCTAVHLPPSFSAPSARMPWNGEVHFYPDTVAAIVGGIIRKHARLTVGAATDPWEEVGFRVFGPLLTGFLLWLRVAIEQKPPDRILLMARDSYFVMQQLERFLEGIEPAPRADYVYASRGSLLLPAMVDFPQSRLNHLFSGRAKRSVARHLRRLGLQPEILSGAVRAAGFDSIDDPVENGDPRMRDLLGKVQHLLLRESAKQRPLVQAYLDGFVGDARDVMLVDVGWVGNMQASIVRLLGSTHPNLKMRGYYVGLFVGAADNASVGHTMHGWLTQPEDRERFEHAMWWSGGVEILEFALMAPHGTTLGYERGPDGSALPIIESNDDERAASALAARLQRGAAAFVDDFLSAYGSVPAEGLNSRSWGSEFYRLVTDPTPAEAELFGDLTHSDAAGDSAVRLPLAPKIADRSGAGDAIDRCYWKSGFMVRNGLDSDDAFDEALYRALNPDVRAAIENGPIASGHQHWLEYGQREKRIASFAELMRRQRELDDE